MIQYEDERKEGKLCELAKAGIEARALGNEGGQPPLSFLLRLYPMTIHTLLIHVTLIVLSLSGISRPRLDRLLPKD
jgi:hypothetical protein